MPTLVKQGILSSGFFSISFVNEALGEIFDELLKRVLELINLFSIFCFRMSVRPQPTFDDPPPNAQNAIAPKVTMEFNSGKPFSKRHYCSMMQSWSNWPCRKFIYVPLTKKPRIFRVHFRVCNVQLFRVYFREKCKLQVVLFCILVKIGEDYKALGED